MTDRLMSLLGLCRRAGKIVLGYDPVIDSINQKKAKLVIIAQDCSQHTAKGVLRSAHMNNVKAHVIPYTKDDISVSVGNCFLSDYCLKALYAFLLSIGQFHFGFLQIINTVPILPLYF